MKIIIHKDVIESVFEYSRAAHPKEFFAFLKGKMKNGDVIVEQAYYHPVLSTEKSVSIMPSLETHEHGIVGTAHSHPNSDLRPSRADLKVFSGFPVNILSGRNHFSVFDNHGKHAPYTLVNVPMQTSEIDKIHSKIFFEAVTEREKWVSSYQNSILLIVFAALMLILIITYLLQ